MPFESEPAVDSMYALDDERKNKKSSDIEDKFTSYKVRESVFSLRTGTAYSQLPTEVQVSLPPTPEPTPASRLETAIFSETEMYRIFGIASELEAKRTPSGNYEIGDNQKTIPYSEVRSIAQEATIVPEYDIEGEIVSDPIEKAALLVLEGRGKTSVPQQARNLEERLKAKNVVKRGLIGLASGVSISGILGNLMGFGDSVMSGPPTYIFAGAAIGALAGITTNDAIDMAKNSYKSIRESISFAGDPKIEMEVTLYPTNVDFNPMNSLKTWSDLKIEGLLNYDKGILKVEGTKIYYFRQRDNNSREYSLVITGKQKSVDLVVKEIGSVADEMGHYRLLNPKPRRHSVGGCGS